MAKRLADRALDWALVIVTTLGLSAGGAQAADAGCHLVKAGELPVKFENNQPMVQISINGKHGWFLVDTGAVSSTMFGGAAQSYGLARITAGVQFYGVGGVQDAAYVVIPDFALSGVKVRNARMFVIGHGGSPDHAGILGREFLGLFNIEFDLANKTIRLWQAQNCGAQSLAYWTNEPAIAYLRQDDHGADYEVQILVNGKAINAILDSGANTSVLTPSAASMAGVRPENYAAGVKYSSGIGEKKLETRIATFDTVTIGDEQVKHAKLEVADLFAAATETHTGSILEHRIEGHQPSMLLGADFLRSHRVLLVSSQHRLYFTYSGGPVFQIVGEAVRPANAPADVGLPPPPAP